MGDKSGGLLSALSTPVLPTSAREAEDLNVSYPSQASSSVGAPYPSTGSSLARSDEGEDEEEDEGVLFYVNKTGFPIAEHVYQRMWDFACKKHPDGKELASRCKSYNCAVEVPVPKEPKVLSMKTSVKAKLKAVQSYMEALDYNHTGTQFFDILKNRPIISLMEVCKKMIQESLPIKCLEATVLGVYLTNGISGLERFPLSFKSKFSGKSARHVVLGVYHNGLYGSLGMSRRTSLAYKSLQFESLSALVSNFESSYAEIGHKVARVAIGVPVSHDSRSFETIVWGNFIINGYWKKPRDDMFVEIDKYAKEMRTKMRTTVQVPSFLPCPPGVDKAASLPYTQQLQKPKLVSNNVLKKSLSSDNLKVMDSATG